LNASAPVKDPVSAPNLGSDLQTRLVSAFVLIAIAAIGIYVGGVWAGIMVAVFVVVVHLEWSRLVEGSLTAAIPYTAAVAAATLLAGFGMVLPAIVITLVAMLVSAIARRTPWQPAGILYAATLGISVVALRIAPGYGVIAIVFTLAVVWATDSGALLAGRLIGGAKLWPRVSPNKTWAGAIGGTVAGVAAGLIVTAVFPDVEPGPAVALVAFALSIAGQVGDLAESAVKRRFGAKDSGNIIPGHGGMMDRLDSLVFAAALAFAIGWVHAGPSELARGLVKW
jgi:phosphatidate cytidylyltransferase